MMSIAEHGVLPSAFAGYFATEGFKPNRPGPYRARSASDRAVDWPFWFVEADGINCMSGTGRGAVFTTRAEAERLAKEWNGTA